MAGDVKKMVVGFNHNIKHKGKMYHIQTEDSGLENPHLITHLFVGGNILASKKTSYADIVGADNLAAVVRELMEEQHKEMLRNLINGVYDDVDEAYAAQAQSFQPGEIQADGRTVQLQPSMRADAARQAAEAGRRRPAGPAAPARGAGGAAGAGAGAAQRRRRDALRRGPDQREEPRRGDPLLPGRGPGRSQVGRGRR